MALLNNPITQTEAYHGGIDLAELRALGIAPEEVVDFSSNILPDGPSPRVLEAVRNTAFDQYPDRESTELRTAISRTYQVDFSRTLAGNGCCELIHLVSSTFLKWGDRVLIVGPTFSEYQRSSVMAGGIVEEVRSSADVEFAVPVAEIESRLQEAEPKMVWLCNPNNPTGKSIEREQLLCWMKRFEDTLFVIDESYMEFVEMDQSVLRADLPNLIVLRSMTKFHAIAGLRLGFLVASEQMIAHLRTHRIAWSINSIAQAAGVAALHDIEYYGSALSRLKLAKQRLVMQLASICLSVVSSDSHFFLIEVKDAVSVRRTLLQNGFLVRSCASFALPSFLRIAARLESQNDSLVKALRRCV